MGEDPALGLEVARIGEMSIYKWKNEVALNSVALHRM